MHLAREATFETVFFEFRSFFKWTCGAAGRCSGKERGLVRVCQNLIFFWLFVRVCQKLIFFWLGR